MHGLDSVENHADVCTLAAAGQTCTPPLLMGLSPFNFTNFFDGVGLSSTTATFSVSGNVRNTASNTTVGGFMGVFAITFEQRSYQQLLADMSQPSNLGVTGSFSGTIRSTDTDMGSDVVAPEPATSSLMLAGVALIVARSRRNVGRKDALQEYRLQKNL